MAIEFFHIRENDDQLVEQLIDLEATSFGDKGLQSWEILLLIRYARVYVAAEYDELLGYVYFIKCFDDPSKAVLQTVSIKPSESGRNVGVSLIISALSDLRESGIHRAEVCVDPTNYKALKIYREQLGFSVVESTKFEPDPDSEMLILQKNL